MRAVPRVSKPGAEEHNRAVRQKAHQPGPIPPSQAGEQGILRGSSQVQPRVSIIRHGAVSGL